MIQFIIFTASQTYKKIMTEDEIVEMYEPLYIDESE